MQKSLNWLIFGAGAIGTYIGVQLALHDYNVVFIDKPEVSKKLQLEGLRLEIEGKQNLLPHPKIRTTLTDALREGPFDVAVFALKSYDTDNALRSIPPYKDQLPPFLCLQNGVENDLILANELGADKVISGTVTSALGRRAAGDIILERRRGMGIADGHLLSPTLVAAFNQAEIHAQLFSRAADMKWSKLLTNLLANASSAILDMSPQEIFKNPKLFRLEITQIREALAVMDAQHIRTVDLPKTPVRALAWIIRRLPAVISRPILQGSLGKGRGGKMPSLYIDLHSGILKSEVNWLNGAVVRFGEVYGIPTPVNRALNDTLLAIVAGKIQKNRFINNPDLLLHLAGLS